MKNEYTLKRQNILETKEEDYAEIALENDKAFTDLIVRWVAKKVIRV